VKKRSLTLIEVVIALAILGTILGILFSLIQFLSKTKATNQALKQTLAPRHLLYMKLKQLAQGDAEMEIKNKVLTITKDNFIDPDPSFIGKIKYLLYLDQNALCLATWGRKKAHRLDVLMSDVRTLEFESDEKEPTLVKVIVNGIPYVVEK
jgi:hypothetical protein